MIDDSDIFLDAVFFSAVKKSNHEKALRMIEEGISLNINDLIKALKQKAIKYSSLSCSSGINILSVE